LELCPAQPDGGEARRAGGGRSAGQSLVKCGESATSDLWCGMTVPGQLHRRETGVSHFDQRGQSAWQIKLAFTEFKMFVDARTHVVKLHITQQGPRLT
jgi:hypothetical protein